MLRRHSGLHVTGLVLVFALLLMSCMSGGDSKDTAEVFAVTVNDNGSTATMEVFFRLTDNGAPLAGVAANNIRFTIAKLIPGASPSSWQSYINRLSSGAIQATYERASTTGGVFTDNGDGTYSYKFSFNFRAVTNPMDVTYDSSRTHRIAMQVSDNVTNATYDFIPNDQNATPETRDIVANASCSECHERLALHGGDRVSVKYCVTCHNPGSEDPSSGNTVDFKVMIHKIHRGADLPEVQDGGIYAIGSHDYSMVVFPQDIRDCIKCHNNEFATDADNWKNEPSEAACTACHESKASVNPNFPFLSAAEIATAHLTSNATPHNPNLPPGVPNIQYVLISAAVEGNTQAVIYFKILRDGVPLDLLNLPADLTAASNRPSFILAYAQAQDGIATPAEYNNLGRDSAQPQSVSLSNSNLVDNGDGTFTATIASAFPDGANLRAVGLQGYFQVDTDGDGSADYPLHTPSAVIAVSGDSSRREVVDSNNCAKCHEWFEGHGGNRVFNMRICVFCHNPNLSSSGRRIDPADASENVKAVYGADPLQYPEATLNFKDMIHGIHSGATRTTDYEFVRDRQNGIPYNFSEVIFPQRDGNASNCLACHKPGTYTVPLVDNTLLTTNRTTGVADGKDADFNAVLAARASVPNDTDFVITPTAAACYACHDGEQVKAHMEQNGAVINSNRSTVLAARPVETCELCHGTGKIEDLAVAHAGEEFTLIGTITAPTSSGGGGGGQSQVDLCGPGPISSQPAGHTDRVDCCSCHNFN